MKRVNSLNTTLFLGTVFLIAFTSGCSTGIRSQVTVQHKLPQIDKGKTFIIQAEDATKQSSLEFQSYATQVARKLEAHGYQLSETSTAAADYTVLLDYGIDDSGTGYSASSSSVGNPYAWNSGTTSGSVRDLPSAPAAASLPTTYYEAYLTVAIRDNHDAVQPTIYEGRVVTQALTGEISLVLPTMIKALFQNFPGESGKQETVVLKPVDK